MPLSDVVLASSPAALVTALEGIADLAVVGVDVERADWNRYYRTAALIQVGGQGRVVVVDPLALDDLSALDDFLRDRVAVFHALENDLEPLAAAGVRPGRVEDTAVAAALLGLPTGLETLLAAVLGITLAGDKQAMQRSDWEARPLTGAMVEYAAGDVADLPALWAQLYDRLAAQGREEWYRQALAALLAQPSVEERREWTRTKGAGHLDPAARGRLRTLWETREALARETDTAPGRIAGDAVLVDLATRPLARRSELGRRGVRRQ
ncbi:MAG: HRDC domain-containing protein, partial [Egibacteraceae bacterium]